MKYNIRRKISLERWGGSQYENVVLEVEQADSFEDAQKEIDVEMKRRDDIYAEFKKQQQLKTNEPF